MTKRPSYLKRQKEQQRVARAAEKREARRARKHAKNEVSDEPEAGGETPETETLDEARETEQENEA
jgi:hypothetical protein